MIDLKKYKPGIYWNGRQITFGFWLLQESGKLYFSNTPVAGSEWKLSDTNIAALYFLCSLEGKK